MHVDRVRTSRLVMVAICQQVPKGIRHRSLLKWTTIICPDTLIYHSAPNEEQVRGVLGKRMGNSLEFAGKVVLIPGGNSGIGAAAARRVAELGAQVVLTGRRQNEGQLIVNDIKRNGGSAAFIEADLSQTEQVKRIVPFTVKTFGRLDYAFNNAGISGETGCSQIRPREPLTASSP